MLSATDLKNGKTFLYDGDVYKVIKYSHSKIARGGGNVRLKLRNLKTGEYKEETFSSNEKFKEAVTVKKSLKYLYSDKDNATFMDEDTYEQIDIIRAKIEDELKFIKEGQDVEVLMWEGTPLSVNIPPKVNLKVVKTAPGVKGDTTSNVYKPAELENGITVKVPLFVKSGDVIKVDTRKNDYIERVS